MILVDTDICGYLILIDIANDIKPCFEISKKPTSGCARPLKF
jgi:hypothetical protein